MIVVQETEEFIAWLKGLRDANIRAKILVKIKRLQRGNPGDVAPIGEGLSEMRIHCGPGYRVYYKQRGDTVALLYGGDKGSQQRDIAKAKQIARELEDWGR
jgi:putative addiction module killer protein